MYINNVFASFSQLSEKFKIPRCHFFAYLQVRDFIRKRFPNFPSCPPETHLDHIMALCLKSQKKRIAIIYEYSISMNSPSLDIIKQRWEAELGFVIGHDIWDTALINVHSSSICARHSLIQFKVLHRLHYCNSALAKLYPNTDPNCCRCKIVLATLYHMFWGCPELDTFWSSFLNLFSVIFKKNIHPCPLAAIFGVHPANISTTSIENKALSFSSLLARRLI